MYQNKILCVKVQTLSDCTRFMQESVYQGDNYQHLIKVILWEKGKSEILETWDQACVLTEDCSGPSPSFNRMG